MNETLYQQYETLLLQRDKYEKEAGSYLACYLHEFGELITEIFRLKVKCIELKKSITFCQQRANRGEAISRNEMATCLAVQMTGYYEALKNMINDANACKTLRVSTQSEVQKAKRIFRKIARKLHPDLTPVTAESERLLELWNEVMTSYHQNDAKRLEELAVLVNLALEEENITVTAVEISDLEAKIEAVEAEIHEIISTEPYQYKYLLEDKQAVEDKKTELQDEYKEYNDYKTELEKKLNTFQFKEESDWTLN